MRFNKLDLNLLVALNALLLECSITRAAERHHMSTSAMSSALARLREYFDDELLVQVGRKMELTARAEVLRDTVRDVLHRIDTSVATRPEFVPGESDREFRICASDYSWATLIPHAMRLAWRQGPAIRFNLQPQVENPQRALDRGDVDLIIMPEAFSPPSHPTEFLLSERFTCVVWQGSALARSPLTLESYAAAGHVVTQPWGIATPAFEGMFMQQYGLSRRIEVTTHSFALAARMVLGSDRIATVHHRLALQAQKALPVALLEPPMAVPEMRQTMQWHKYRSQDPGIVWLRQLLHDAAREMDVVGVDSD